MAEIGEIGVVRSDFKEPADPFAMRKHESTIIVHEAWEEGLAGIEENRFLLVLYHFHLSRECRLRGTWYHGQEKGVFAGRSPLRPGKVGLTVVELLARVRGLDALDGTPVMDIKPYAPFLDEGRAQEEAEELLKRRPRGELLALIKNKDFKSLLLKTGELHGHFCPGVALGVMATTCGLHALAEKRAIPLSRLLSSDGLEELLAVVETNNCFADGVQYVTGCTLGNNGLIYKDFGKTAVTLSDRSGEGIRLAVRPDYRALLAEETPGFQELFDEVIKNKNHEEEKMKLFKKVSAQASFKLLEGEPDRLFTIEATRILIPGYAPIRESATCSICGESVMRSKMIIDGKGRPVCRGCAHETFFYLSGEGIGESPSAR